MTDKEKNIKWFNPLENEYKPFDKIVYGFDIETETKKNFFTLCSFVNDTEQIICKSEDEVVDFLENHPNIVLIATNLAFDWLGIFAERVGNWAIFSPNGGTKWCEYYPKGDMTKVIKVYDTICFMPSSVEKLGKLINVPKMKHPQCFNQKPQTEKDWKELSDYCINDSYISYKFFMEYIIKFINHKKIKLSPTIPSVAMTLFRTDYLKDYIKIKPEQHSFIKLAYYGGRTETFKRGSFKDVVCYDFNSLYPSIMSSVLLPDPNTEIVTENITLNMIHKYDGVAYIEGYQDKRYIPLLPFRNEDDNNKLIFPIGNIKGVYSHIEIREALKNGFKITKLGKSVFYHKSYPYLKSYAEDLYRLRQKYKSEKNPFEITIKTLLNSLYGKFGIRWEESKDLIPEHQYINRNRDNITKCVPHLYGGVNYFEITETNKEPLNYAIPIWAVYITAYARLKLYSYLCKPEIQEKIISCDTDSLFMYDNYFIETSDKLGDLKKEYENKEDNIFVRPKVYMTKSPKWKGFKIKDNDTFKKTLSSKTRTEERFVKMKTAIKMKDHYKLKGVKINEVIDVTKKIDLQDTKRVWKSLFKADEQQDSEPINIR